MTKAERFFLPISSRLLADSIFYLNRPMSQPYHQLQIIHPNGQLEFYPLTHPSGLTRLGNQADNDVILYQANAAPFQLLLYHQPSPMKLVHGSGQMVTHKGQPLPPHVTTLLNNLDVIQVAGYTLILLENPQVTPSPESGGGLRGGVPSHTPSAAYQTSANPYNFAMSEPTPKSQTLAWSRQTAQLALTVTNNSPQTARFRIEGRDKEAACTFEFSLPHEPVRLTNQAEFSLPATETGLITIHITPNSRPFISLTRQQSHYFTLTISKIAPDMPSRAVLGEVNQRPLIGPGMITMLVITTIICLLPVIQASFDYFMASSPPIVKSNGTVEPTHQLTSVEWRQTVSALDAQDIAARFYGRSYRELFQTVSHNAGLDEPLLTEIAYRESRFNPLARGPDGELGLMQIPLAVWQERAEVLGLTDPYEPYSNLVVASDYLLQLKQQCLSAGYQGNHWVLAGYKLGPPRLQEILTKQGSWADVPLKIRRYALDVMQASAELQTGPGKHASWQAVTYSKPKLLTQSPYGWLQSGQVLTTSALNDLYHIVAPGDTLETVAQTYQVNPAAIFGYADNHLTEAAALPLGQWLIIPQAQVPAVLYSAVYNEAIPKDALIGSGVFMWPTLKNLSQDYSAGHPALDIRGRLGTAILAADSGYVVAAGWQGPYGNAVMIDHGNGFQTLYAHLASITVAMGSNVVKGDTIGLLGTTGNSTGPHVHFEIHQDTLRLNPINFLPMP